jgi:hypothetical protein
MRSPVDTGAAAFYLAIRHGAGVVLVVGIAWAFGFGPLYATSVEVPATSATDTMTLFDDRQSAMFAVRDLEPGDRHSRDITVTYRGSTLPAAVVLYASTDEMTGNGLEKYLHLTVEIRSGSDEGAAETFIGPAVFSGTLDVFRTLHTSYADGVELWIAGEPGESRTLRFTVTLLDDNRAQGLDTTVAFTWESQIW